MTLSRLTALTITSLVVLWLVAPGHAATPRTLVAKVERVSDGDTIVAVTANGTKLRIRLLGIDVPEILHGTKPGQSFAPLDTGDREA